MEEKTTLTIHLRPGMLALMQKEAKETGLDISTLLIVAFAKLVEEYEYQPETTEDT